MNKESPLYNRLAEYGLNLHTLSTRSGVSYSTVYNLFTGKKKISDATGESLYRLCRFLGLSMDELYYLLDSSDKDDDKPFPDFLLMWKDEVVGNVTIGEKEIHINRYSTNPVKQIFYKETITRYEFGEILRHRCWDENRPDLDVLLGMIGLNEFNPYEICKKTHGLMVQDFTWFKFEGETLTFDTVRRRKNGS